MSMGLFGVEYGGGVVSQVQAQEPLGELYFQNPNIGHRMGGLDKVKDRLGALYLWLSILYSILSKIIRLCQPQFPHV